jgi:cell division protein FtsL
VVDAASALGRLSPQARRALLSQLATLDLSDSAVISATHDTGQLRYTGRRELAAIDALERDVTNDSLEQSTTAVLDKVSGAGSSPHGSGRPASA